MFREIAYCRDHSVLHRERMINSAGPFMEKLKQCARKAHDSLVTSGKWLKSRETPRELKRAHGKSEVTPLSERSVKSLRLFV